jgi:hypothetical protein
MVGFILGKLCHLVKGAFVQGRRDPSIVNHCITRRIIPSPLFFFLTRYPSAIFFYFWSSKLRFWMEKCLLPTLTRDNTKDKSIIVDNCEKVRDTMHWRVTILHNSHVITSSGDHLVHPRHWAITAATTTWLYSIIHTSIAYDFQKRARRKRTTRQ